MRDIICIGHITHDKIVTPALPEGIHCAGGTAYYVAWAMNALPHDVDFSVVTSVGGDLEHEVERLRKAGVCVVAHPGKASVYFENSYGVNMNNRKQRVLSKADPFTIEQLQGLEAKVFHLGTLLCDDFSPEVVEMLAEKGKVSIDVQGYLREVRDQRVFAVEWADKLRVLKYTDILKVNEHEIDVLTDGERDLHRAARMISSWGVSEVLITLGSYGSVIYAGGRFYEIPGYPPFRTIDATGCGDTYSAGYLYARHHGAGPGEAGRIAAAMCTLKLEHNGPFKGTIDDVYRVMRSLDKK